MRHTISRCDAPAMQMAEVSQLQERALRDRRMQARVHLRVYNSTHFPENKTFPLNPAAAILVVDRGVSRFEQWTFAVDGRHTYFFENNWPDAQPLPYGLAEEHLVPSGFYREPSNEDYGDLSRRFKLPVAAIDRALRLSGQEYRDNQLLQDIIADVRGALNEKISLPFTKRLFRANRRSGDVDMFNCVKDDWEQVPYMAYERDHVPRAYRSSVRQA